MKNKNLLEELVERSPGMEIWWDSSPLVFDNWCVSMQRKARPDERKILKEQFSRMFNLGNLNKQLFRGVTTNPRLSLQAIKESRSYWEDWAANVINDDSDINTESLYWKIYKEIVKLGARAYFPLFEKTKGKEGFLSAQTDPRNALDCESMINQGLELAAISPNLMVKIPGTREGYSAIENLTAKGISTNNTLSFTMSQFSACSKAVKAELETAQKNGVNLHRWRSVITSMESRFGDLGGLRDFGAEKGITLNEGEVRLAELAIFKKAYDFLIKTNSPCKMLSCSLRIGPTIGEKKRIWHLEEKVGANIVVTCPPSFMDDIINLPNSEEIVFKSNSISKDIPKRTLTKLMHIPFFEKAYFEDGYTPNDFNIYPTLIKTSEQFSAATLEGISFANSCLHKFGKKHN